MTSRPEPPIGSPSAVPASVEGTGFAGLPWAYEVPDGHLDELLAESSGLRSHWRRFADHAGALAGEQLSQKQTRIARQIHENGVTYNVYAAAAGPARPWGLDVLPLVLPAAGWELLTSGLRQRARLLNAMAADFYGEQCLLKEGLVPPALVLAHPGFLRACHGVVPPSGVFLHQVAFDLAHGPDGRWWVVGTRAQAPSGAGYALENRVTVSRLFPDAFRELRVHMLAPFFRVLLDTLLSGAPSEGETPHVALLTPGPYNETYFEHAYLARYLGFTLVEGGDLVVRDDRVYLKTLSGLRRVHAILRRLDDDFCDPLELRADSTLGVPGLVQAWRSGQVLIANAFGTGVLESPGLFGFLPAACRRLLGEEMALPSVATWWCGEPAALEDGAGHLGDMVIKPAFPDRALEPVFGGALDPDGREEWLGRLRSSPELYCLQERLPLSHAPVFDAGRLESRAMMLRVFLASDGRGDYHVMPGGLNRIAGEERHVVSGQYGGSSKDTWVLSDAPVESFSLLPGRLRPEDIERAPRPLSSRAGEGLFWLGRYAERSENVARLLRAVLTRLPDRDALPPKLHPPIVRTCVHHGLLQGAAEEHIGAPHRLEHDLIAGMFEGKEVASLAFNVGQTVRVAGTVRERLSTDNSRLLNRLIRAFSESPGPARGLAEGLELVDRTIVSLVAVGGLELAHMTRDDGWRCLGLGRLIERLLYVTSTVAEVLVSGEADEPALLEWLLDLSDSVTTYRARYMRPPEWLPVADLLLFDRTNPRSAAFQLVKLVNQVRLLPEAGLTEMVERIDRAWAACREAQEPGNETLMRREALATFLRESQDLALGLSDALTLRYFSHVSEPVRTSAAS
jgi:uncharacterized circularly permuted ATP-grasp superfamily protein/uncharacterized alpha-E superfamily protein